MARVTVEDCILQVPNRFELVMLAAQRARNISAGATLTVERDNDKNPVVALREIADQTVELSQLKDNLIKGLQKFAEVEEPEEEELDLLAIQQELVGEGEAGPAGDSAAADSDGDAEGEDAAGDDELDPDAIFGRPADDPDRG